MRERRRSAGLAAAALSPDANAPCWLVACGSMHASAAAAAAAINARPDGCKGAAAELAATEPALGELEERLELRAGNASATGAPVLAFCDPHAAGFAGARDELLATGAPVRLRYRPATRAAGEAGVPLSGFGARLALKSSEYLAVDDRAGAGGESPSVAPTTAGASESPSTECRSPCSSSSRRTCRGAAILAARAQAVSQT